MNRTRPLALAVVLLFLFGVVGLVTVDEDEGGTVLTTAAEATTAEGSAHVAMEVTVEVGDRRTTASGEGVVDLAGARAQMAMTSSLFAGPMEIVTEGTTVYLKATLPQLSAQAGGKPWLSYQATTNQPLGGGPLGGADPLGLLRLLQEQGAASNVRQDGGEPVRGVATTRYTADLDLSKMAAATSVEVPEVVEDVLDDAEATMTVWIGAGDVVRRSSMAARFGLQGTSVSVTVTVELYDFGVPVQITVPPPDQVRQLGAAPAMTA